MAEYYITPENAPAWRFDPQDFLRRIHDRWPNAHTAVNTPETPMAAEALIRFDPPQRELGIALSRSGYAVYLDPADPGTTAEFVAWYVTQVPDFQPEIYLYTTNFDVKMALHPGTTPDEVRAFLQPDHPEGGRTRRQAQLPQPGRSVQP